MEDRKNKIRKTVLEVRSLITQAEVYEKSCRIIQTLMGLDEFKNSSMLMCYVDFRNEVSTKGFIEQCLEMGKRVAVPLVYRDKSACKKIVAVEIFDLDGSLEKGTFGILEPKAVDTNFVAPTDFDLIIVPGVAFDGYKNRIGYGAGYYDAFLVEIKDSCKTVGLAFDIQFVDEIPVEKHDVPLDIIVTESRIIK